MRLEHAKRDIERIVAPALFLKQIYIHQGEHDYHYIAQSD
jgi:hypothetical protein